MKLFDLIEQLENIYQKHGNLDVYVDYKNGDFGGDNESDCPHPYAGFISCTGQCYSKYDFDTFPEDYPEKDEFDENDLVCII